MLNKLREWHTVRSVGWLAKIGQTIFCALLCSAIALSTTLWGNAMYYGYNNYAAMGAIATIVLMTLFIYCVIHWGETWY